MKKKNNEGFSLVELIIVIAIMAVLIVVLAPQFIKFVEKGRESTDLQDITEVKTTVETYVADHAVSGDIVVTATVGGDISVSIDGVTDKAVLAEYGIADTDSIKPVESEEWDADIVWTYSKYMWKLGDGTAVPAATYLDANGEEVED